MLSDDYGDELSIARKYVGKQVNGGKKVQSSLHRMIIVQTEISVIQIDSIYRSRIVELIRLIIDCFNNYIVITRRKKLGEKWIRFYLEYSIDNTSER